jgi:hypothetical protein
LDVKETVSKSVWQTIVDKATWMKFSTLYNQNNKILDNISAQLKACELVTDKKIQHWCQDNPGENKILEQNMVGWQWTFKYKCEYTTMGCPIRILTPMLDLLRLLG